MADTLQNRYRIGFCGWILSQIDQSAEQLVDIGQVEISGQYQTAGHPVVFAGNGMHIFNVVLSECPVTQMA